MKPSEPATPESVAVAPTARSLAWMLEHALSSTPDLEALAYVDTQSGLVLWLAAHDAGAREPMEMAAMAASQLCGDAVEDPTALDVMQARAALVVSATSIHAFARAPESPGNVVVGLASSGTNVALLLAAVRAVAKTLAEETRR